MASVKDTKMSQDELVMALNFIGVAVPPKAKLLTDDDLMNLLDRAFDDAQRTKSVSITEENKCTASLSPAPPDTTLSPSFRLPLEKIEIAGEPLGPK